MKVAVAMSGGVDSSVTAALLLKAGHEPVGFTMRLGSPSLDWEAENACCGLSEIYDARRVADRLGFPHYVLNHAEAFDKLVVKDFISEYVAGRTPNPCIRCNKYIKFDEFLKHAQALGCEKIASGHHARIVQVGDRWHIARGKDPGKDQSYVLYCLSQEQLSRTLMPVGDFTKEEVRQIAEDLDLINAEKPDSQDICFVARGFHGDFVAKRSDDIRTGPIVDHNGEVIGEHKGLPFYTPGQRRQLGLKTNLPYYVKKIDATTNTVFVAPEREAMLDEFTIKDVVWQSEEQDCLEADFQLRYGNKVHPATFENGRVRLDAPLLGISPGQSAVAYNEDLVLMGGVIDQV